LTVLTEDHIEICRLLVSFILAEIGRAPAHCSCIEDSPHARPNVASMEPHRSLEHRCYSSGSVV
jgi:hypothetical protein